MDASYSQSPMKRAVTLKNILFLVIVLLTLAIFSYIVFRWRSSGRMDDDSFISNHASQYFDAFYHFNNSELTVLKKERRENYYSVLCSDQQKQSYLCLFRRDSLFLNRYKIISGTIAKEGELASIHIGETNKKVFVFGGFGLPNDVSSYSFDNDGIVYICPILDESALNLFVFFDSDDIRGIPKLLDKDMRPVDGN